MPTLEEIRAWARGLLVPGLPRSKEAPPEEPAPVGGKRTRTYKINAEGTDALLKFGKHRGRTVGWLAVKQPDYLRWILGAASDSRPDPFDDELRDVVRYQLTLHGERHS